MQTFQAKLSGIKRHPDTPGELSLIILPENNPLGRTHCWVKADYVKHLRPPSHKKPINVTFTAKIKPYLKRGTIPDLTLCHIKNLKKK
jgi:hypothetical protein